MSTVFADSFYFIALGNPNDRHHAEAVRAARQLSARILTTHYVLIEVADALSSPRFRSETARFLVELSSDPGTEVVAPDVSLYQRGLELHARRSDKGWSLTDCISFVVMSERGFTDALTADHHFEQAGFNALLKPERA